MGLSTKNPTVNEDVHMSPDAGGANYITLGDGASLNASGQAAFRSNLLGGTTARGIFLLPEPTGVAPWAATLASLALLQRRRQSPAATR